MEGLFFYSLFLFLFFVFLLFSLLFWASVHDYDTMGGNNLEQN